MATEISTKLGKLLKVRLYGQYTRKPWLLVLIILVTSQLLAACASGTVPAPIPTRATPATTSAPTPVQTATPALTPQDAEWQKVVIAAKQEGTVIHYTAGLTGESALPLANAFENKYGIKVEFIGGRGAEFVERLKTEKRMGRMVADTTDTSAGYVVAMKKEGLLVSAANLPVFKEGNVWVQDPWIWDSDKTFVKYLRFYTGPHINTNIVKPEEAAKLKSWRDFLDPKWRGRMAILDPVLSVGPSFFAINLQSKSLDKEFLAALGKQELKYAVSGSDEGAKLARGEVAIGLTGTTSYLTPFVFNGAPIKPLDMKEGIWSQGTAWAIVANAPHPNAAKLFTNFVLTREGQSMVSKGRLSSPMRKDAEDYLPEGLKIEPQNPIEITQELNDLASESFAKKELVPLLKPQK